jgi:hypothetical protein
VDNEIEIISDDEGIALIGNATAIELFLSAEGIPSRDLTLPRLSRSAGATSSALQAGSVVASESGRWVKLTEQSAELLKHAQLMKGPTADTARAIIVSDGGKTSHILQLVSKPATLLANPAVLAGVGGLMAQMAMQKQMDDIAEYLAVIDAKVDDVIRAQKDAVLADMIGVELVVRDAMDVREQLSRVPEVTWSKLQGTEVIIARTQAYALLQLKELAAKAEKARSMGDLAEASERIASAVRDWLAVVARCLQLQNALAVLELDRVLESAPEEVEAHRAALVLTRRRRATDIAAATEALLERMGASVETANDKVLLHPSTARAVLGASNRAIESVVEFHEKVGIESNAEMLDGRRWRDAASDARDKAMSTGAAGREAATKFGGALAGRARAGAAAAAERARERMAARREGPAEFDAD